MRGLRTILTTAAVVALTAGGAQARTPVAHAAGATKCSVGSGEQFGYTYLTSLTASRTSCGTATTLAKKHGRESGWKCATKRLQSDSVQYVDRVTCNDRSAQVVWIFSQNT